MEESKPNPKENRFFNPCGYCCNFARKVCFDDCIYIGDFRKFKLRPGTGIKDLPDFPIDQVLRHFNPRFRLIVISTYVAAITDYLQHEDEYKFRKEAPNMESKLDDEFRRNLEFKPLEEV